MRRLAAIRPPATPGLVALHSRADRDVHSRGRREAERLAQLREIKLVDVEHGAQTVRGVGVDVRAEALFRGLVVGVASAG